MEALQRLSRYFTEHYNRGVRSTRTPESPLCTSCSVLNIITILRRGVYYQEPIHLGHLVDIIHKADHCRFCHLIASLFRRNWCLDVLPDVDLSGVVCSVYASSIGTLADPHLTDRKRCHRLQFAVSDCPEEVTRVLERTHMGLRLEIQLLEEDAHKVRRAKELHGRRMTDTVDMALLKSWLSLCEREHGDTCAHFWWGASKVSLPRFVRMVDVTQMSIVQAPSDCRYVALSYVWGAAGDSYWTTMANLGTRSHPAGLDLSTLPATIVDTIHVTRAFGERYLWIDALCIIQDSSDDKADQIQAMDLIYSSALLTIFSAAGESVRAKLPGISPGSRAIWQPIEVIQGLHLVLPLPSLKDAVMQSVWDTRGWTFQELLISRRRLFFTKYQVYFECVKDVWCEDVVAESRTVLHSENPIRYLGSGAALFMGAPPSFPEPDYISSYFGLVARYTLRRLSYLSDVILAITALTNALTKGYQLEGGDPSRAFRYGMQIRDLNQSLLWQPRLDSDHVRRVSPDNGLSNWPSWAWAGWVGAVLYNRVQQFTTMVISSSYQVKPSESLIGDWYLVDDARRLVRLGVERIKFIRVLGRKEPSRKYKALVDEIDEQTIDALPPPGTLVFRTQCTSFRVSKLDMAQASGDDVSVSTPQAIFGILSDVRRPSTCAGRIILPSTTPSPNVFTFIVLSRCDNMIGLYDEDVYERYDGGLLYVMAVRWAGDDTVQERVGLGVISEQAWLESDAKIETVFLG